MTIWTRAGRTGPAIYSVTMAVVGNSRHVTVVPGRLILFRVSVCSHNFVHRITHYYKYHANSAFLTNYNSFRQINDPPVMALTKRFSLSVFPFFYFFCRPIVIVGAVFGSLVTILILGALIAVCYGKYKRGQNIRKTRPSNRTGRVNIMFAYVDILARWPLSNDDISCSNNLKGKQLIKQL